MAKEQFLGSVPTPRPVQPFQVPNNRGTADIILQAAGLDRQDAALRQRAAESIGETMQGLSTLLFNIGKQKTEEKQAQALLELKAAAERRQNDALDIDRQSLDIERQKAKDQRDALNAPPVFGKTPGGSEYAIHRGEFKFAPTAEKVAGLKDQAKSKEKSASVAATYRLYETARDGLLSALEKTKTGPVYGMIPGLTEGQQTADAAVAAMAPVLKQLFRVAGEGVFTDKDQELLLKMVSSRKTLPEARIANSRNIDNIVRAKLGIQTRQLKNGETVLVRKTPGGWEEIE